MGVMQGMRPIFVFGRPVMNAEMAGMKAMKAAMAFIGLNNEIMIGVIISKMAIMNVRMSIIETKIATINPMITIMV
jgi:hypothetical protein